MSLAGKDTPRHDSPLILAIETATAWGSVALTLKGKCLAEYSLQSRLTHSKRLLAGIRWLMQEADFSWPDVDGIAVSLGPGSFTGLRIGLSTAKGLAFAAEKPLLGVPTLDGLACQFSFVPQLICPILDARKKEVYAALFRCDADGIPRRASEYMVIKPEILADMIKEPTIIVGDGVAVIEDTLIRDLGELLLIPPMGINFPRAAGIGMLAAGLWQRREFLEPSSAVPIYIRASDAELNFVRNS